MSARSISSFIYSATIAIMLAIVSDHCFPIVRCIIVYGSFGSASGEYFGCFVEVNSKLRREDWRGLSKGQSEKGQQKQIFHIQCEYIALIDKSRGSYLNSIIKSTMAEDEQVFFSKQDPEWVNKTRTLIVSSKGMTARQRNFMLSIFALMPHSKKQYKLEKDGVRDQIEQLCQTHKTRYFIYFEVKKRVNFSAWLGRYPEGPSLKVGLDSILSLKDVRFQGNSVKGARHILSFDGGFQTGKMALLKELLIGIFNVPKYHPKSTGVIDHVLNFTNEGGEVGFRNYQIFRQAVNKDKDQLDLYEIGPRFLMNVNCILEGVMGGEVLYRAPVIKSVAKKSKFDKRKLIEKKQVKPLNVFGEEQD